MSAQGESYGYLHPLRCLANLCELIDHILGSYDLVIWLYDYVQTFHIEVESIWSKRVTGVSILFILNRYLMIANIAIGTYFGIPGPTLPTGR